MRKSTRLFVSVLGAWMGLAGVEHGVGEILQGNGIPTGIMIQSWPGSAFFRSLGGEPAMTILPSLLFTGILAVLVSLLFMGCAIFYAQRRHAGLVMMLLTLPMLLFGGGMFPPVLCCVIGAMATRIPAAARQGPVTGLNRLLGKGWWWIFSACCAAWMTLLPGVAVLDYTFGIDQVGVTLVIMLAAFSLFPLAYVSSLQRDRLNNYL